MTLQQELAKPEYQWLTNTERLALLKSKSERVVGKIAYGNTLHLVSMLARGLRKRIDTCLIPDLKYAWNEALQPAYLSSPSYSINVALPEIRTMLDSGKAAGVCTQAEYDFIIELASYDKPLFPDVTLHDVIAICNPELIDGTWHDLGEVSARQLIIKLKQKAPEQTHILVQSRDVFSDGVYGDWRHNTACYLEHAGVYRCDIRAESRQEVRWSCAYALDVEVG